MRNDILAMQQTIEQEFENQTKNADKVFSEFISLLDNGTIRTVEKVKTEWTVNHWVKKGILLGFRLGKLQSVSSSMTFPFFDKHTFPLKVITLKDKVRIVPGGTSIRKGAYVSSSVIIMPPAYINVGAYIEKNVLVDSHALVGSCAYIGERVHLSAAAQIGGVLEPIGALPVIIENDVLIGGNCGIYEGTIVKSRAVIGSGVTLNGSTPVYDLVNETVIRKNSNGSLVIPENAVVIAGSRAINTPFAMKNGLQMYTPLIVKYRDEKTDAKTALEESLR
ncbi:MAG TPA: 2,3,4,5-tetrahydropyridine-2,6-dicarboxylate N-succinyltransferase [Bacteroidetes bacterium]|nr:2,3,4,5-tetrahydropyridine-2,6-dicarboxylate N-succinyltransferase [Bacteroidota bacterium]